MIAFSPRGVMCCRRSGGMGYGGCSCLNIPVFRLRDGVRLGVESPDSRAILGLRPRLDTADIFPWQDNQLGMGTTHVSTLEFGMVFHPGVETDCSRRPLSHRLRPKTGGIIPWRRNCPGNEEQANFDMWFLEFRNGVRLTARRHPGMLTLVR
jgi:hypothetical protein